MATPENIQSNLQSSLQSVIKIEESIAKVLTTIAAIKQGIAIVSPSSEIDVKIKELQIKRDKLEPLTYQKQLTNLDIKKKLGQVNDEEYNKLKEDLDKSFNDAVALINEEITKLQQQKEVNKTEREKLKQAKEKRKKKYDLINKQRIKEKAKAEKDRLKNTVKTLGPQAIVITVSYIVNFQTTRLSKEVANLELLVDNVNNQIDNIQTQADIEKAKIARNQALLLLNNTEKKLSNIKKILKTITTILTILSAVILALQIVATVAPIIGVKALASALVSKLLPVLLGLLTLVASTNKILDSLLNRIIDARNRLKQVGDIIESKDKSNFGKLGYIDGADYKGFKFYIKEENDPKFVVQGFKRRFAVAISRSGIERLKSDASFTLDPDVLIEELKLVIDQENLQG
jgi:hypothetical protein